MSNKPLTLFCQTYHRINIEGVKEPNEPITMTFCNPMRVTQIGRKLYVYLADGSVFVASLNIGFNKLRYHNWIG